MPFVPLHPSRHVAAADRLSTQLGIARELALTGSGGPARKMCGSVFLDNAMALCRDEALLTTYVECLLLLEMTALLPRVIQAVYGITLDIVPMTGPDPRRWRLTLGNGLTLTLSAPGQRADRNMREDSARRSSRMILRAAAQDAEGDAIATTALRRPEFAR